MGIRNFFLAAVLGGTIGPVGGADFTGDSLAHTASANLNNNSPLEQFSGGGLPTNVAINSIAINPSGIGLIGGQDSTGDSPAYAARVNPDSLALEKLSGGGLPATGIINSVAINTSGVGLIGGKDFIGHNAYAARVTPDSSILEQLSGGGLPTNGAIYSVAINTSGFGLIGGGDSTGDSPAYAARVNPDSLTLEQLSGGGLPTTGIINSVVINASGVGLIGGQDYTGNFPGYAARVNPDSSTLEQLSGGGLPTKGVIKSIAINPSGVGLIGGQDHTGDEPAYAARINPDSSTLEQLSGGGLPTKGVIYSVAINDAEVGIIGGQDSTGDESAYAARINPNSSTLEQLSGGGLPTNGVIYSVAINNAEVGIIEGADYTTESGDSAYVALVAPNGSLTPLTISSFSSEFSSVTINNSTPISIINAIVPPSLGPYASTFNIAFAQANVLQSHFNQQKQSWENTSLSEKKEIGLLACADWKPKPPCTTNNKSYCFWIAPFNDFIHQSGQSNIPSYTNEIAGVIAAFDYRFERGTIGGGLAYAFDYADFANQFGHASMHEEAAVLYGILQGENFFFDAALWGGIYQLHNVRHNFFTSTGSTNGWILSPHVELSYLARWELFALEPFAMADWANSWQRHYTEKNEQGFALVVPSQYSSLLRSEVGLRFYETFHFNWGKIFLEEKASYINRTPFSVSSISTFFIGAISTFSVTTGSSQMQSLGGMELCCSFVPWGDSKAPYGVLDFQGEFGSSFQSYFVSVEIGKTF